MKRNLSSVAAGVVFSLLLAACGGGSTGSSSSSSGAAAPAAPAAQANTLTAVKTDSVSMDSGAAFWANSPKVDVATTAANGNNVAGPAVTLQAAYDGKSIALRLEWADTTDSALNKAWIWDGSAFKRSGDLGDRMGVLFPMGNDPAFASKGCTAACHNSGTDQEKWWMGSDNADTRYDLWQWTAAGSNPVGQAQDEWMGAQEDPADMESATHGDALESGGSLSNVNAAKDGPAFMGADLTSSFIISGQQVAIDTTKLTKDMAIPASALSPWVGSRGDVQAKGEWKDGKWVVVLMRALDTGHDDEVVLTPPKPYTLGVAVFDHIDLLGHSITSDAVTLNWK